MKLKQSFQVVKPTTTKRIAGYGLPLPKVAFTAITVQYKYGLVSPFQGCYHHHYSNTQSHCPPCHHSFHIGNMFNRFLPRSRLEGGTFLCPLTSRFLRRMMHKRWIVAFVIIDWHLSWSQQFNAAFTDLFPHPSCQFLQFPTINKLAITI